MKKLNSSRMRLLCPLAAQPSPHLPYLVGKASPWPLFLFLLLFPVVHGLPQFPMTIFQDAFGQYQDEFGYSVATLNGFALCGGPTTQSDEGLVNTFHWNADKTRWIQDQKITLWNPAVGDWLGWDTELFVPAGTQITLIALVSAPGKTLTVSSQGVAYIFAQHHNNISQWDNQTVLVAPDADIGSADKSVISIIMPRSLYFK